MSILPIPVEGMAIERAFSSNLFLEPVDVILMYYNMSYDYVWYVSFPMDYL